MISTESGDVSEREERHRLGEERRRPGEHKADGVVGRLSLGSLEVASEQRDRGAQQRAFEELPRGSAERVSTGREVLLCSRDGVWRAPDGASPHPAR